ncbi:hypothetical protein Dimus_026322 [Dionaea muscipula]
MHTAACKEFYANLTMFHYKKHEVARSKGESRSAEKFYDGEDEVQEPADVIVQDQIASATFPASPADSSIVQKEKTTAGVDPIPSSSIPDSVVLKLQAELEQARARKLQADLDKAQAENARLLTLLQQTQSQPKP